MRTPSAVALILTIAAGAPLPAAIGQCTPGWLSGAGLPAGLPTPAAGIPGVDGTIHALTEWDPDGNGPMARVLIAGGSFAIAGESFASNIAMWDGVEWSALPGTTSGISGAVYALAVDSDNGLLAAGAFTIAGGTSARRIARFDGVSWSPVGLGTDSIIYAMATLPPPAGSPPGTPGTIFIGGQFTTAGSVLAPRIAEWDGTNWSGLSAGMDGTVRALVSLPDGSIVAGGEFQNAGGAAANRIARWDGQQWGALGAGANSNVLSLAYLPAPVGGDIIAGGQFSSMGGQPAARIARWNTQSGSWSAMGDGMTDAVNAVAVLGNGQLIAAGAFLYADGQLVNRVSRWTGAGWTAIGTAAPANQGAGGIVHALAAGAPGTGDFTVGGAFTTIGGIGVRRIAAWTGNGWERLGTGLSAGVVALMPLPASYPAPGAGQSAFIAGGQFSSAGDIAANRIAIFDGEAWQRLGDGMNGEVRAAVVLPGSTGDEIIAGGVFTEAGGIAANRIARWDGQAWAAMDIGVDQDVRALAVLPEHMANSGGRLVVGGRFASAGPIAAGRIARWDPAGGAGGTWSPVEGGVSQAVESMAVLPGAQGGGSGPLGAMLAIGGAFTSAGPIQAQRIATWGEVWDGLGNGANNTVLAITVMPTRAGHELVIGGSFTEAGSTPALRIARWTGTQWLPLGTGMNNAVSALAVLPEGDLVAGGVFTSAGGGPAQGIARWDGAAWHAMLDPVTGVGLNGSVGALAVLPNGQLVVGGEFTTAGGRISSFLARWGCETAANPCYANCDNSTLAPVLNVDDFTCFINQFSSAQSLPAAQQVAHYANCDGSQAAPVLNVDDFTCFIGEFAQGCR